MSFFDNPIIDTYSINSEESELKMRTAFSQKNGFICRTEVPDKGCDFNIELILDEKICSSWNFAIQLKSTQCLKTVAKGELISYSFETSRLGYLLRKIPAMGLLVIYSIEQNQFFYEYVDNIFAKLCCKHGSTDWQKRNKVAVHIPFKNVLNNEALKNIHTTFRLRYENASLMQNIHGPTYDLPISIVGNEFYDFKSFAGIKRFISKHGWFLLNNYEIGVLYESISKLPLQDIYADKDTLLISIVVYFYSTQYLEARLLIEKITSKYSLDENEFIEVRFIALIINKKLGYITPDYFKEQILILENGISNDELKICIKLSLLNQEMLSFSNIEKREKAINDEFNFINCLIENIDSSITHKLFLKNASLSLFTFFVQTRCKRLFSQIPIYHEYNVPLSNTDVGFILQNIGDLQLNLSNQIAEANKIAFDNKNDLAIACTNYIYTARLLVFFLIIRLIILKVH